jgi:hypothetical protein
VTHDRAGVEAVLNHYFDGLYRSDPECLRDVLHPRAHYVTVTDGNLTYLTVETYLPIVAARPSPASRNEVRADRIVSVDFAGPLTARAHVECRIGPKVFTDFLTLIHDGGEWRIISKVFHYELKEQPCLT